MNIAIEYGYRDGYNSKHPVRVVLAGELTSAQIDEILAIRDQRRYIIAGELGLPEPQADIFASYGADADTDHPWCELTEDGIEATAESARGPVSAAQLLAAARAVAARGGFDEAAANKRLGIR